MARHKEDKLNNHGGWRPELLGPDRLNGTYQATELSKVWTKLMAASSMYSISYDADGDVGSEVEAKNDLL